MLDMEGDQADQEGLGFLSPEQLYRGVPSSSSPHGWAACQAELVKGCKILRQETSMNRTKGSQSKALKNVTEPLIRILKLNLVPT